MIGSCIAIEQSHLRQLRPPLSGYEKDNPRRRKSSLYTLRASSLLHLVLVVNRPATTLINDYNGKRKRSISSMSCCRICNESQDSFASSRSRPLSRCMHGSQYCDIGTLKAHSSLIMLILGECSSVMNLQHSSSIHVRLLYAIQRITLVFKVYCTFNHKKL